MFIDIRYIIYIKIITTGVMTSDQTWAWGEHPRPRHGPEVNTHDPDMGRRWTPTTQTWARGEHPRPRHGPRGEHPRPRHGPEVNTHDPDMGLRWTPTWPRHGPEVTPTWPRHGPEVNTHMTQTWAWGEHPRPRHGPEVNTHMTQTWAWGEHPQPRHGPEVNTHDPGLLWSSDVRCTRRAPVHHINIYRDGHRL